MFQIAGFVISGFSLVNDLIETHQDLSRWVTQDLQVDRKWLPLAIEKGLLSGSATDYAWSRAESAATKELRGTHTVIVAYNDENRTLYQIVRDPQTTRRVLMKRLVPVSA